MFDEHISRTIERIREMERCFDGILAGIRQEPPVYDKVQLRHLLDYYEGGQWLADYELDEQGLLPRELKRGVLSQDGVYDLLTEIMELERQESEERK